MDGSSQAERNAMAQRLIARNKLAEALDLLNETIRQDPRFAETFENRAQVFEALGMHPQAEADRRKAAALRAAQPAAPAPAPPLDSALAEPPDAGLEEGVAPALAAPGNETSDGDEAAPPESTAEAEGASDEPEDVVALPDESGGPPDEPPPTLPSYPPSPRRSIGSAFLRAAGVVAFALGVFGIAGAGIYFALNTIGDDAGDSATPAPTESPTPTDEPDDGVGSVAGDATDVPATVEEALSGSPYSFSHLEDAWHARALAVSIGEISESVTGFGEPAVDITLTGDGATMELSVLIYSSADAKDIEWTLGVAPEPKVDGELPSGSSVWYNANAVVVVRVVALALRQDALDGFLAVGENAEE